MVEEQTGNMDPKTNFRLIIVQTELERFKFVVRSFLRARMKKVKKKSFSSIYSFIYFTVSGWDLSILMLGFPD